MEGKKTYAFLILAIIGWLGFGDITSQEEVGEVLNRIFEIVGILGAIWGRAVAKTK